MHDACLNFQCSCKKKRKELVWPLVLDFPFISTESWPEVGVEEVWDLWGVKTAQV